MRIWGAEGRGREKRTLPLRSRIAINEQPGMMGEGERGGRGESERWR